MSAIRLLSPQSKHLTRLHPLYLKICLVSKYEFFRITSHIILHTIRHRMRVPHDNHSPRCYHLALHLLDHEVVEVDPKVVTEAVCFRLLP